MAAIKRGLQARTLEPYHEVEGEAVCTLDGRTRCQPNWLLGYKIAQTHTEKPECIGGGASNREAELHLISTPLISKFNGQLIGVLGFWGFGVLGRAGEA